MDSLTVQEFLKVDFSGDGDGYGDGSGSGYGDGSGDGSGDGDGYGDGYGDGDGYGYGSGYGYGDGSGDGDGDGYGDGDGLKSLCGEPVYMIDGVPTIITGLRGSVAMGFIVMIDLSKRKTFVVKSGGKFAHGADLHAATTEIYTLSLHDALPIYSGRGLHRRGLLRLAPSPHGQLHAGARRLRAGPRAQHERRHDPGGVHRPD